jgi:hypothetical protein
MSFLSQSEESLPGNIFCLADQLHSLAINVLKIRRRQIRPLSDLSLLRKSSKSGLAARSLSRFVYGTVYFIAYDYVRTLWERGIFISHFRAALCCVRQMMSYNC